MATFTVFVQHTSRTKEAAGFHVRKATREAAAYLAATILDVSVDAIRLEVA